MKYAFETVYNYEKLYMTSILLIAIILTVVLAVFTYSNLLKREQKIALLLLHLIILFLQTAQFLAIMSPPRELIFFTQIEGVSFCLLGLGLLFFSYTTRYHNFPTVWQWVVILTIPLLGIFSVLSNGVHQHYFSVYDIFYIQYHKLYLFISTFNVIYALIGLFLLYQWQKQEGTDLIRRFLFNILVIIILFGAGILQYLKPGLLHYNIIPAGICFFQLFFIVGNRDKLSIKSVLSARTRVLDYINEAIILTDSDNRILYHNQAPFNKIIESEIGKEIQGLLNEWMSLNDKEFFFYDRDVRYDYTYYMQTMGSGKASGILYAFKDISKYKNLIRELDRKSQELKDISQKLSQYTKVVRTLTEEKERNKILEQIYCTVGYSITQIIKLIQEIEDLDDTNVLQIKEKVEESIRFAREGIQEIRQVVSTLSYKKNRKAGVVYDDEYFNRR